MVSCIHDNLLCNYTRIHVFIHELFMFLYCSWGQVTPRAVQVSPKGGGGLGRSGPEGQVNLPSFQSSETNLSVDWLSSEATLSLSGSMFFISHSSAL